jgi:ubiquinone/menaquinone biosynthesis C-methylase UbiE
VVVTDPRLASSLLHADIERLRAQATLSWPREARALAQLGMCDSASILEVGCGPGFVTEALLTDLPHSAVTAVDLDPAMCAHTRWRLADHLGTRLRVVETSILLTDLPADSFDFALARFVFQHLTAPDMAVSEIRRLLKPGGRIAILDVDDDLGGVVAPRLPALEVVAQRVHRAQAGNAGDRQVGRKLWRLLAEAGFTELELTVVAVHSDELGLAPFLPQFHPDRYRPLMQVNGLTQAEWESYRNGYEELLSAPDAFILQLILLATGRKPASDPS